MNTPIKVAVLAAELKFHPDKEAVNELLQGLVHGFHTGLEVLPKMPLICKNLLSAHREPLVVTSLLAEEVRKGYVVGPFDKPPFKTFRVSPLGVATGKYSGKKRLIVDLSAPHDVEHHFSFNELID